MSNKILFVFEGENIERQIFKSIEKYMFFPSNGQHILRCSFKGEIYQLWQIVKDDADFDIIEILKERPNSDIKNLSRKEVSEVHLFFDHDAHSHSDTITQQDYHERLNGMLDTFNNEFERGKLWISYPMAEAIKHCKKNPENCFYDALLNISDNTKYRKIIDNKSDFKDIRKYDRRTWNYLTAVNVQRTFCLVNDMYSAISDYSAIKQWFEQNSIIVKLIHKKQYDKFICSKNEIVALSPFPLFLLYYFGENFFIECKCHEVVKACGFSCYQK